MRNEEIYFIMTAAAVSKQAMGRALEGFRAFTSLREEQKKRVLFMEPKIKKQLRTLATAHRAQVTLSDESA